MWRSLSLQCKAEAVLQKARNQVLVTGQAAAFQRPACSAQSLASGSVPLLVADNKLTEFNTMQYSSGPVQAS